MTQINIKKEEESAINAKEMVMQYIEAINRKDFKSVRRYVSDSVSYVGPVNEFHKAETYLKYLEHIHLPRLEIKKIFPDADDVCEFHEVNFDTQYAPLLMCMWFHVDNGKISSIRIVFDPRPFLQEQRAR